MIFKLSNAAQKYYHFWLNLVDLKNRIQLLPVDFYSHWSKIMWRQKGKIAYILVAETIDNAFYTLIPLLIGWIVKTGNLNYFYVLIALWLTAISLEFSALYYASIVHLQTMHSIMYEGHKFFLTVDPIFHSTRSSGKIIGKIDRGASAYDDLLDVIGFDLLPTVVGISTIIIAFSRFDFSLALLATSMIFIIGIFNVTFQYLGSRGFEPHIISAHDKLNNISLENLAQINFIRSCFASNEMDASLKQGNQKMMYISGTSWIAFAGLTFFTRFFYVLSILILGIYLIILIKNQALSIEIGTALLMTYINGSYEIMRVGKKIRRFNKSITRITDLFTFIKHFGKQTYPVLSMQTPSVGIPVINRDKNDLVVYVHSLFFEYNPKAKIFDNHTLDLAITRKDTNKLYGIIGPSGIGKTTFISILGGQLNPSQGEIFIQDVDIYKVDDFTRKYLVALQGQVASSMRGTIRYNLLFGLPKDENTYSDEQLVKVLESVGLWQLFAAKDGLNTLIGESGLNLSGGQRQRLNFANLYLRAKYYNPALILIDEPTSSLDEVSEKAITRMIDELAQDAITFVIAHRLNTLEQARAILDFSLVKDEKLISFYSKDELLKVSKYYQQLMRGEVSFE